MQSQLLSQLSALSAEIGANASLVQGAGGNTSLKHAGRLHIKASGTWLADAASKSIFVALELDTVIALARAGAERFQTALVDSSTPARPSIETPLHALLPQPFVVHVHSINTIAWTVEVGAHAELCRRLAGLDFVWVDYARPGQPLTRALLAALLKHGGAPDIVVLQNHGLIVCGADCGAVARTLWEVEARLARAPRSAPFDLEALVRAARLPELEGQYRPAEDSALHDLATLPDVLENARSGVLVPDQAVFVGRRTSVFGEPGALGAVYLLVPGAGALTSARLGRTAAAQLRAWRDVLTRVAPGRAVRALPADQVDALCTMESEKYRLGLER